MELIIVLGKFIGGFALLAFAADRFIASSIVLGRRAGMSTLLMGMLIVGFGTSLPEMIVSMFAAYNQVPELAIGNAIGSNIMNTGLILGIAAVITPLTIHSRLIKLELPFLIFISIVIFGLFANGYLSRLDGIILILLLIIYLSGIMIIGKRQRKDIIQAEFAKELPKDGMSVLSATLWWIISLIFLFVSSDFIVNSATTLAKWMHISDLIIGLTVVALGTSLPELATTIVSALRKEHDIAVGNIIGSNIFNLLAVLAMPALICPTTLSPNVVWKDYPVMLAFMVAIWVLAFFPGRKVCITRSSGVFLIIGFCAYLTWLICYPNLLG